MKEYSYIMEILAIFVVSIHNFIKNKIKMWIFNKLIVIIIMFK